MSDETDDAVILTDDDLVDDSMPERVTTSRSSVEKVRPRIELSNAAKSRVGAECGQMADVVRRALPLVKGYDRLLTIEVENVIERLTKMRELFQ